MKSLMAVLIGSTLLLSASPKKPPSTLLYDPTFGKEGYCDFGDFQQWQKYSHDPLATRVESDGTISSLVLLGLPFDAPTQGELQLRAISATGREINKVTLPAEIAFRLDARFATAKAMSDGSWLVALPTLKNGLTEQVNIYRFNGAKSDLSFGEKGVLHIPTSSISAKVSFMNDGSFYLVKKTDLSHSSVCKFKKGGEADLKFGTT